MPVRVKDRGAARMVANVARRTKKTVSVGVIGQGASARTQEGTTVAEVAAWAEFGTDSIPARSFIRGYVDENEALLRDKLRGAGVRVAKGDWSLEQALGLVGLFAVTGIRNRIDEHIPPPLAASTVARKGHDKPLVDTRQLYVSITHEVE